MFAVASVSFKLVCYLVDGFITGVLQPQVDHGVLESPAHVELQRQIIHPLHMRQKKIRSIVFLCTHLVGDFIDQRLTNLITKYL